MSDSVNYRLVTGQLAVCNASSIVTTPRLNSALAIWNNGVSATKLVNSCTNWGVQIVDVTELTTPCTQPAYACAQVPNAEAPLQLHVYMEPDSQGSDNWTISILGSELGHNLGFNPHLPCPSIMSAAPCDPLVLALSQVDKDNYHKGYHVDAVSSFAGTGSSGTVNFTWNSSNIHNESAFLINWRNDCTGQWQIAAAPAQNASSFSLPGQQGGPQQYQILGLTSADTQHATGDVSPVITVNVSATLAAPASMTSTFPSTTATRFTWSSALQAHHYKLKFDVVPSGMYVPSCIDNITPLQYNWTVPTQHQVPWYTKVMACTSASLCSAPSTTHTLTERFNSGAWNYVFTTYRSGTDNIFLKFINFNPNLMALKLHIRNGDTAGSPLVTDSACISNGAISSVGPMSAAFSFSTGKIATQGHGILNAGACAPTDANDSTTVGWGYIPPQ